MAPDQSAALRVFGLVRLDLNHSSIRLQQEVMRGLQVVKPHRLIAPLIDIGVVLIMALSCWGRTLRWNRGLLCSGRRLPVRSAPHHATTDTVPHHAAAILHHR